MAHYSAAQWRDLGTGSACIEVIPAGEFSQDFSEEFVRVQRLNADQDTNRWFVAQWEPSATEWFAVTPVEGVDRCYCGSKYWDGLTCHSCGEHFKPAA